MSEYQFSDDDVQKWMASAKKVVIEAGELIKTNLGKAANLADKGQNISEGHASSVLTETDLAVEKLIRDTLQSEFNDHQFIGEEGEECTSQGQIKAFKNNPTWIIDPIDGTMNFVHGNPLVCTSVGLAVNRRIVAGIVNCPVINHMYTAIKGHGAYLNGTKLLKTSNRKSIKDSMILLEMPTGANPTKKEVALTNMTFFMEHAHAVRCPGPAATDIAWIGAASADAFVHMGIHCWDMAAGALIVTEAGGTCLHTDGSEFNLMGRQIVAAASEDLAREIVSKIKIYKVDPEFSEHCPL